MSIEKHDSASHHCRRSDELRTIPVVGSLLAGAHDHLPALRRESTDASSVKAAKATGALLIGGLPAVGALGPCKE